VLQKQFGYYTKGLIKTLRKTKTSHMNRKTLAAMLITGIIYFTYCNDPKPKPAPAKYYPLEEMVLEQQKPVNVEYFKNGQILVPDMVIKDSLIVMDAAALNYDMGRIEQGLIEATDGEISAIFYKHCKAYKTTSK